MAEGVNRAPKRGGQVQRVDTTVWLAAGRGRGEGRAGAAPPMIMFRPACSFWRRRVWTAIRSRRRHYRHGAGAPGRANRARSALARGRRPQSGLRASALASSRRRLEIIPSEQTIFHRDLGLCPKQSIHQRCVSQFPAHLHCIAFVLSKTRLDAHWHEPEPPPSLEEQQHSALQNRLIPALAVQIHLAQSRQFAKAQPHQRRAHLELC